MPCPQSAARWAAAIVVLAACDPSDPNDQRALAAIALGNVPAGPVLVGTQLQLTARGLSKMGDTIADVAVTWRSSDPSRATVSTSGLVAALDTGMVEIAASAGGASAKAPLDLRVGGGLCPAGGTLAVLGGAIRLDAPAGALNETRVFFARPTTDPAGNVRIVPGTVIELSPNNTSLSGLTLSIRYDRSRIPASLPESSLQLYALSGATWTQVRSSRANAGAGEVSGAIESTGIYAVASTAVSRIELAGLPVDGALFPAESRQLAATPVDVFGTPLAGYAVSLMTSDPTKATIVNGLVTAIAPGQATLRATADGQSAETVLTVLPGSGVTMDSLRVGLSVSPGVVTLGESFTARWVVKNIGRSQVMIITPESCLGFVGVLRGDQRQGGFPDTDYGCLTVVTERPVLPGDSLIETKTIRTNLAAGAIPPGNYDVRVLFRASPELPTVSHPVRFR